MKSPDQRWVEILEDPGRPPREREGAAQELVELCRRDEAFRERYLMRFVTLLADEHPAVRGWGIVGVLLCDEKLEHLPRIVRLLEDPSPGVRLQAVHALTPLGIETIRSALLDRLEDEDRLVRVAAAVALAVGGDPASVPALLDGLSSRRTRFDALLALRDVAPKAGERRGEIERAARSVFTGLLSNRFDRLAAASVLASLGDEGAGRYVLDRARKGKLDRPIAIEWMGELKIPAGEKLLLGFARDPKDPFRGAALRGLGAYGSDAALEFCTRALDDEAEDADVRCDAAEGLLLLGGERARQALESAAEKVREERVRRVVSVCLSLFGKPVEELRSYLPLTGEEIVS